MAKAELGIKRLCGSCGVRFYDFKRSPILCPGCGAEFDPNHIVKSRKAGRRQGQQVAAADDNEVMDIDDDDLNDLDDLDDQADLNSKPKMMIF